MPVTFELPPMIEDALRARLRDLEHVAKEAFLVEMYRQRLVTGHQMGELLGLCRFEIDALLKRHNVFYELTASEVRREAESLAAARNQC